MHALYLVIKTMGGNAGKAIIVLNQALELLQKTAKYALIPFKMLYGTIKKVASVAYSGFKKVYDTVVKLGTYITTTLVTGFRDFISDAADRWMDFEREADRAFGLIAGEGTASFQEVKEVALRVSNEVGKSLEGVQKAVFETISAGFRDLAEAEEVVRAAGQLAIAGWIELDQALKVLITTMEAYGLESSEAARVTQVLYLAQQQGRGTMGQFAMLLSNVLPIASAYGITLEDAAMATALVTKVMGMHGRVMFSIVAALRHMREPTAATAKAWEEYGYSAVLAANGNMDFTASLKKLAAIRKEYGHDAIRRMFKHQAAMRGISSMTMLAANVVDVADRKFHSAEETAWDFMSSLNATMTRINWIFDLLIVRFNNFKVVIVDIFEGSTRPIFDDFVGVLLEWHDSLEGVEEALEKWKKALSGVVEQIRKSEIYRAILKGFTEALKEVNKGSKEWYDWLMKLGEGSKVLDFLDKTYKKIMEWYGKIVIGAENWNKAFKDLSPQAREVLTWIDDALKGIDISLWSIVSERIPAFLSSLKDINVAVIVKGWMEGLDSFVAGFANTVASIGKLAVSTWLVIKPTLVLMQETLKTLTNTTMFAMSVANQIALEQSSGVLSGEAKDLTHENVELRLKRSHLEDRKAYPALAIPTREIDEINEKLLSNEKRKAAIWREIGQISDSVQVELNMQAGLWRNIVSSFTEGPGRGFAREKEDALMARMDTAATDAIAWWNSPANLPGQVQGYMGGRMIQNQIAINERDKEARAAAGIKEETASMTGAILQFGAAVVLDYEGIKKEFRTLRDGLKILQEKVNNVDAASAEN